MRLLKAIIPLLLCAAIQIETANADEHSYCCITYRFVGKCVARQKSWPIDTTPQGNVCVHATPAEIFKLMKSQPIPASLSNYVLSKKVWLRSRSCATVELTNRDCTFLQKNNPNNDRAYNDCGGNSGNGELNTLCLGMDVERGGKGSMQDDNLVGGIHMMCSPLYPGSHETTTVVAQIEDVTFIEYADALKCLEDKIANPPLY